MVGLDVLVEEELDVEGFVAELAAELLLVGREVELEVELVPESGVAEEAAVGGELPQVTCPHVHLQPNNQLDKYFPIKGKRGQVERVEPGLTWKSTSVLKMVPQVVHRKSLHSLECLTAKWTWMETLESNMSLQRAQR